MRIKWPNMRSNGKKQSNLGKTHLGGIFGDPLAVLIQDREV